MYMLIVVDLLADTAVLLMSLSPFYGCFDFSLCRFFIVLTSLNTIVMHMYTCHLRRLQNEDLCYFMTSTTGTVDSAKRTTQQLTDQSDITLARNTTQVHSRFLLVFGDRNRVQQQQKQQQNLNKRFSFNFCLSVGTFQVCACMCACGIIARHSADISHNTRSAVSRQELGCGVVFEFLTARCR